MQSPTNSKLASNDNKGIKIVDNQKNDNQIELLDLNLKQNIEKNQETKNYCD